MKNPELEARKHLASAIQRISKITARMAETEVASVLRQAGLKSTQARIAAYLLLNERDAGLTHADAAKALQSKGLDKAVVYRNLMDFVQVGLAQRFKGKGGWRFQLVQHAKVKKGGS